MLMLHSRFQLPNDCGVRSRRNGLGHMLHSLDVRLLLHIRRIDSLKYPMSNYTLQHFVFSASGWTLVDLRHAVFRV
jgi:hypothetical protein